VEEEEEVEVIIEHWKLTELPVESRKRKRGFNGRGTQFWLTQKTTEE
jgi:hypothetical protein